MILFDITVDFSPIKLSVNASELRIATFADGISTMIPVFSDPIGIRTLYSNDNNQIIPMQISCSSTRTLFANEVQNSMTFFVSAK